MIQSNAVELFHKAAHGIPAYRTFLTKHGVEPSSITKDTFHNVPLTTKKDYLVPNTIEDLVWKEDQQNVMLFCSTSGSTGEAYYFPRTEKLSQQYSVLIEEFLNNSSYGSGKTLVLLGFGMGVWIGGVITLRAFELAGARVHAPVSILPVGYNKTEIFKALKKLAPQHEQTVIVGYPPFIKELTDEAQGEGVDFSSLRVRLLFAAESFTETFRNYVCKETGITDPLRDTLNIYGTADIGAMAYETPLSILVRRLALEDPLLTRDLFGQIEKTPTLAQYNPEFITFELVDGQVVLTGDSAMPLIRYAVGDSGGVLEYEEIEKLLFRYEIDLKAEIKKVGIEDIVKKHPFVFVYERTDLSVTLHGINIYPEFIKEGMLDPQVTPYFTERFTMSTKNDVRHNQFLQINVELQKGVVASKELEEKVIKAIKSSLIKKSSEFAEVSKSRASGKLIQAVLWRNGHPRYFAPGTKQKWVEKPNRPVQ